MNKILAHTSLWLLEAHPSLWLLEAHQAHGPQASHDPPVGVGHVWHWPSPGLLPAIVWTLLKPSQAPDHWLGNP